MHEHGKSICQAVHLALLQGQDRDTVIETINKTSITETRLPQILQETGHNTNNSMKLVKRLINQEIQLEIEYFHCSFCSTSSRWINE